MPGSSRLNSRPFGNFKLRGKKYRLLSCGCCAVQNFKTEKLEKVEQLEIKTFSPKKMQAEVTQQDDFLLKIREGSKY